MKTIIVTGASGFIGIELCRLFDTEKNNIYAILRSESSYSKELKELDNCIPVYCDSGYYYNKIDNICIKYPIEGKKIWWIILVSVLGFLILAGVVTIIILYKKKLLCFKKKEIIIDNDTNYNINDDLLSE